MKALFKSPFFLLILISVFSAPVNGATPPKQNTPLDEEVLGFSLPSTGAKWPFNTGSIWFHVNTSLGVIGYPSFGNRRAFLPLMASVEYSITPHFAVGPYLGYYRIRYTDQFNGNGYDSRLTSFIFGGRMTFHGTDLINQHLGADIDVKEWDIYSGLALGIVSRTWSVDSRYKDVRSDYSVSLYPSLSVILGARYFINPSFAIHAEIGKGSFGFLSFGISAAIK